MVVGKKYCFHRFLCAVSMPWMWNHETLRIAIGTGNLIETQLLILISKISQGFSLLAFSFPLWWWKKNENAKSLISWINLVWFGEGNGRRRWRNSTKAVTFRKIKTFYLKHEKLWTYSEVSDGNFYACSTAWGRLVGRKIKVMRRRKSTVAENRYVDRPEQSKLMSSLSSIPSSPCALDPFEPRE